MSFQEYAMYAEEFFGPSTTEEGTKYVLENRCSGEKKSDNKNPDDTEDFGVLVYEEWARITQQGKKPDDMEDIARDYAPPMRIIENGVMIMPRLLSDKELRDVARSFAHTYAQKFKTVQ